MAEEQKSKHNSELLEQSLKQQIKGGKDAMNKKKQAKAQSEERSSASQAELDQTKQSLTKGESYLKEVISGREQKAREWKERTKSRSWSCSSEKAKFMSGTVPIYPTRRQRRMSTPLYTIHVSLT